MPHLTTTPHSHPGIRLRDRITVVIGSLFLLGLIISAWVPRSCPLLQQKIVGCPVPYIAEPSNQEAELNRIAHQEITSDTSFFSAKAQDYRKETAIRFAFRGDLSQQTVILQVKKKDGFQDISLVAHPLLVNLDWPSVGTPDYRLYQRVEFYNTVNQMRGPHLPNPQKLAADRPSVREFGLKDGEYIPLESLRKLDGIDYILTSYAPSYQDGTWLQYERVFDFTDVAMNSQNELEWALLLPGRTKASQPAFYLGIVHVDYTKITP